MVKVLLKSRKPMSSHRINCLKRVANKKLCNIAVRYKRLFTARPDVLHQYLSHQNINQYLDYVNHRYSSFVKLHTLGVSYEGRLLKAIEIDLNIRKQSKRSQSMRLKTTESKISSTSSSPLTPETTVEGNRNIIFIEGGTYGREWLTISAALNIIHQLTERHIRNSAMLKRFRFFIVPISNPDGYEYTREKNLRWRKNRRPTSSSGKHFGIDCNRNYDFHWDMGSTKASGCTYKGEKPFSESETRALSTILQNLAPDILLFVSLHSYAQAIMYPWGCSREPVENINELKAVASAGSYAIRAFSGRKYRTGSIVQLSRRVIGGSIVDYAYGVIKVPYAYVMELSGSSYGFQPPAEAIGPIGQECWLAIREMCCCAQTLYNNRPPRPSILQNMREKYGKAFAIAKKMLYGSEASDDIHTYEME